MFPNEITNESFLAHLHANKKIYKNAPCRRFLGKLARYTTKKSAEEKSELEIMAKTFRYRNINFFSASYIDY